MVFQAKRKVTAKAQKHKRPWHVCRVEKNLVSQKPRTIRREQWEEKLESSGDTTLRRALSGPPDFYPVGISGPQGLG